MNYTVKIRFIRKDYMGTKTLTIPDISQLEVIYYNGNDWLTLYPVYPTNENVGKMVYCMSEISSINIIPEVTVNE